MPSGETGFRPRVPRASASISSPIQRASSSPSQWPIRRILLALGEVGPEGLAEAAFVGGDDAGGGGEDVRGGAVVLLEADHLRAGEVLLEAEDVADLGAAPAVDRLVVVADAADVVVGAGEEAEPEVLGDVGVLVLVDEDVAEPALVLGEDVGVGLQDGDGVQEEVAEVAGVERAQAVLVGGVELAAAVVEGGGFRGGDALGGEGAVLPAVDQAGEEAGRPALLVDRLGQDDLAQEAELVVGVEDGEVRLQADELGVAAEDAHGERVEGAEPGHPLDDAADEVADAGLHLAGGLVGEGDGEDLVGAGAAGVEEVRDAGGQRLGLAGAGAGEHEDRAVERLHRGALGRVEVVEVGRRPRGHGAGGERARSAASKASASSLVQGLMGGEGNAAQGKRKDPRSRCVHVKRYIMRCQLAPTP